MKLHHVRTEKKDNTQLKRFENDNERRDNQKDYVKSTENREANVTRLNEHSRWQMVKGWIERNVELIKPIPTANNRKEKKKKKNTKE